MRAKQLLLTAIAVGVLAGCGGHATSTTQAPTTTGMAGMSQSGDGPSATASMICGDEIGNAVKTLFAAPAIPPRTHTWSDRLFRCDYALPAGTMHLSVKDLSSESQGRTYFEALRARLGSPPLIGGLTNLGFPAFETTAGDVAFLKDGKTLLVDASDLAADQLPAGYSREDTAYSIASAVIGCWTE